MNKEEKILIEFSVGKRTLKTFFVFCVLSFGLIPKSYGMFHIEGEIDTRLHFDKVVSAENKNNEIYEGYSHSHITAELFAGEWFSVSGELLLEGEPSGHDHGKAHNEEGDEEEEHEEEHLHEEAHGTKSGNTFFVDHELLLDELALNFRPVSGVVNILLYGGKIAPVFGLDLHDFPGIYSYLLPEEYELRGKVGLGGRVGFDGMIYGKQSFDFSAFAADTTIFSNNEGRRLRKSDGGVSNTGDLSSFALSIGGGDFFSLRGGLLTYLLEGFSYRLSYARQAKGIGNKKDENRFSFSSRNIWPLTENFSSIIVSEYVHISNLGGDASHDRTYATNTVGFDWKQWMLVFGLSLVENKANEREESADVSIFSCSLLRKIGNMEIGAGYRRRKEQGEKATDRIGFLLSYHAGFSFPAGGLGHEGHHH